ncbi:zinc-ribbon domain-containing protein [Mangrovicoccus ximenensis]|uniref:zinc-ribbon domain-containing protein n=1 Tax=Mangrovicoccus ximenensis TaxID=1911570 RepID=UPI001F36D633|nr:zinc-ribbon domain-containing protein [Mangrovicoccus ximenensis]
MLEGVHAKVIRIVCPACQAAYDVPQAAISAGGRDVQCSACGHNWFQLWLSGPAGAGSADASPGPARPQAAGAEASWGFAEGPQPPLGEAPPLPSVLGAPGTPPAPGCPDQLRGDAAPEWRSGIARRPLSMQTGDIAPAAEPPNFDICDPEIDGRWRARDAFSISYRAEMAGSGASAVVARGIM